LSNIQEAWIDSISVKREVKYRPKSYWGPVKTRAVRVVPEGTNQKISIKIEPAGEILN
jgi:hypothetical protein